MVDSRSGESAPRADGAEDAARAAPVARRRRPERRGEILAAAREIFTNAGFDRASMGEIAARAGCVEGTIYTYFRNKRALFDAVLESFYEELIDDIGPRLAQIEGTRDRLVFFVHRHLRIAIDDAGMGSLINSQVWGRADYQGSRLHELNRRYARLLTDILRIGVERGELLDTLDIGIARDFLFGGIQHWAWRMLARREPFEPGAIAIRMVDTLLCGWTRVPDSVGLALLADRVSRLERAVGIETEASR
jgi:TetR/AcrR family fatty acid metabolism transcriptional regulator